MRKEENLKKLIPLRFINMTKAELLKQGKEYYKKSLWCQVSMPKKEYLRKLIEEWKKESENETTTKDS